MIITVSNEIEIKNYTSKVYEWCMENLVVSNPTYEQLLKMGKEDLIRRTHVSKELKLFTRSGETLKIPFGCLYGIWPLIKNSEIHTNFNSCNDLSIKYYSCPLELYDYQQEAINAALQAKSGVLCAGCGAGKTTMGIEVIHRIGKKALWLTHTKDLLKQAAKDMKNLYPNLDIGYITDGKVDIGKDITIATVQTLEKVSPSYYANDFETVIVDECHRVSGSPTFAKMFQKVLSNLKCRYKFGLTATPFRSDSLGRTIYTNLGMNMLGEFEPIYTITRDRTNTLTAEHVKIDVETPYPSYERFDGDGVLDYNALIDYLSENDFRNEVIINKTLECAKEGRKQALLCLRVNHCELLYNKLKEQGLRVELITGKTGAKKREQALNETDNWDVIVSTISLFKEGINIKALDSVHMCSPIKDKSATIQSCGRCERVLEGKKEPKFFDYVDVNFHYCLGAYKKRKSYLKNR